MLPTWEELIPLEVKVVSRSQSPKGNSVTVAVRISDAPTRPAVEPRLAGMPTWEDLKEAEVISHSRNPKNNSVSVTVRIPPPKP